MTDSSQSERWRRVKEIFSDALDRPADERNAFLEQACAGDAALRAEVDDLLAADSGVGDFLDTPAVVEQSNGLAPGELLDEPFENYRLKRVISMGGMGVVYEAEQEHPRRTVAVKVMKDGIASPDALRRFEFEAHVLGGLRHPGIAQVFEAGTHHTGATPGGAAGRGVPFFVMEYVPDALSITDYAQRKKLGTKGRIALFTQVCKAVDHGHQKGIIHRDLKPANILVDAQGQVKVIDFGVARATDSDLALTTQQTDVGQLIGTVQYMSPEQCTADPKLLDTRSDVYSLGVVLYELLCGDLPYDVRSAAIFEASRLIREQPPKRPSTVNRALRGDVETIVLKALEKERSHRYQTLSALADDLQRYLGGEVILARPAGPATKAIKIVRRNPAISLTAFVAVATLIGFFVYIVFWSYPRIRAEHDRAVEAGKAAEREREAALLAKERSDNEAEKARLINDFLETTFLSADPYRAGEDLDKHEMLDMAAARIETEFADQPEIRASLHHAIGSVYLNRGFLDAAEREIKKSIEIGCHIYGPQSAQVREVQCYLTQIYLGQARLAEAESLLEGIGEFCSRELDDDHPLTRVMENNLALVRRAQGRYVESERLLRRTLEWQIRTKGEANYSTLSTKYALAGVLDNLGRYAESERLHREAYEGRRLNLGDNHPSTLQSWSNLANAAMLAGRLDDAEEMYREVIVKMDDVLGLDHPDTLVTQGNLAIVLKKLGALEESEEINRKVLNQRIDQLGHEHPLTLNSINNLANVIKARGRLVEAEEMLIDLVEVRKRVLGSDHPETLESMGNLGIVFNKRRKLAEAESIHRETWEARGRVLGEDHPATLSSGYNLALVLERRGLPGESEEIYREILTKKSSFPDDAYPLMCDTMSNLAILLVKRGVVDEAETYFRRVLKARRETLGNEHANTVRSIENLALFLRNNKGPVEAEELYREVLDLHRKKIGEDHPETLKSLARVALSVQLQERYADAAELWQECVAGADRIPAKDRADKGTYLANLGDSLVALSRYDDAEEALIESFTIFRSALGNDHEKTVAALAALVQFYEAWDKPDEADSWRAMKDG